MRQDRKRREGLITFQDAGTCVELLSPADVRQLSDLREAAFWDLATPLSLHGEIGRVEGQPLDVVLVVVLLVVWLVVSGIVNIALSALHQIRHRECAWNRLCHK